MATNEPPAEGDRALPLNDERLAEPPAEHHAEHTEHTVRSLAQMRDEHYRSATGPERMVASLTRLLARPFALVAVTLAICGWVGANLALAASGRGAIDPVPFPELSGVVGVLSLLMVVLIIGAQRHEEQLAQKREMLILEIVLLSEQKIAKAIALMEEARRDNPLMRNRSDPGAETLAQPADARSVLDAIRQTQAHAEVSPQQAKARDQEQDQPGFEDK
jgi:uncharacterized membrane protein